jgi:hypothetical protein
MEEIQLSYVDKKMEVFTLFEGVHGGSCISKLDFRINRIWLQKPHCQYGQQGNDATFIILNQWIDIPNS